MSVQPTSLRIEPTWRNKGMRVTGWAAVRERVQVTLVGAADVASGVVVRVFAPSGKLVSYIPSKHPHDYDLARFPLAEGDAWEVDGNDLKCVMNFNTKGMIRMFRGFAPNDEIEVCISVEDGQADNLYAFGVLRVKNWTVSEGDPVPGSSALAERVGALEEGMAIHKHDGTDSARISHDDLTDAGSMTHAQLEGKIAAVEQDVSNVDNNLLMHKNDTDNPHNVTAEQVGSLTLAQMASALSAHNTDTGAHSDIRQEVTTNTITLNAVVDALNAADTAVPTFDAVEAYDHELRAQVAAITDFLRGLGL